MELFVLLSVFVVCAHNMPLDLTENGSGKECGVEASQNPLHRTPWLVLLEYYNQVGHKQRIRCAATLIDDVHIVTAAHCVRKSLYHRLIARLGEYNVTSDQDCVAGVCADPVMSVDIAKVQVHENYDGTQDDIAILTLAQKVPYTDFIRPICLPSGSIEKGITFNAAGWGETVFTHVYSDIKKNLSLPYVSEEECKEDYKNVHLADNIICAGGEEGVDTCRGDSGGPLMLTKEKVEFWGITSSGNVHCGTRGTPGIYTNVKGHLRWILKRISTSD